MRRLVAILVAALSVSVAAQQPSPNPPLQATGNLRGTVLCADTGMPARGAIISVNPVPGEDGSVPQLENSIAFTTGNGSYRLENLPPGLYEILIILPGYLSTVEDTLNEAARRIKDPPLMTLKQNIAATRASMLRRHNVVSVISGQTVVYDAQLQRGAALSGHIRYADGSPAQQVTLELQKTTNKAPTDGAAQMEQNFIANLEGEYTGQSLHPDDRGNFRLFGLGPGKYRLAVLQNSAGASQNPGETAGGSDGVRANPFSSRFYAGDTFHPSDATVFDLSPGQEVGDIVITLPLDAFHSVRGSVLAPEGSAPSHISLKLTSTADPHQQFFADAKADGTFLFPQITTGTYSLTCTSATTSHQVKMPGNENAVGMVYTREFAASPLSVVVAAQDLTGLVLILHEIPLSTTLKYINQRNSAGTPIP
jgi:hypothetical protein